MRLTSEYRRVTALFNTPIEEGVKYSQDPDYPDYPDKILTTNFKVGPFSYKIIFSRDDNDRSSVVYIEFELTDIDASAEELIRMMSKFKQGRPKKIGVQEQEQPMSLQEAKNLKHQVTNLYSRSELEIIGPYAVKIFSAVVNIIKDYMENYRTDCIVFTAASRGRSSLYQRMVKSAFPNASISKNLATGGRAITVCFH